MRFEFFNVLLVIAMAGAGFASLLGQPAEITITGQRGFPVALRTFQGAGQGGGGGSGEERSASLWPGAIGNGFLWRIHRGRRRPTGKSAGRVTNPQGKVILERKYDGAGTVALAHRFADDAIAAISGVPGISGSKLAFSAKKAGRKELYVCDYDGSNLRQVTRDNSISVSPSLSADGKRLAYTGYLNGYADIYLIDLASGRRDKIVSEPGTNTGAAFSPAGDRIACTISAPGIRNCSSYLSAVEKESGSPNRASSNPPRAGLRMAIRSSSSPTPPALPSFTSSTRRADVLSGSTPVSPTAWSRIGLPTET